MLIGTGAKLRSVDDDSFLINIGDYDLKRVTHVKCLGVVIDDDRNYSNTKHTTSILVIKSFGNNKT